MISLVSVISFRFNFFARVSRLDSSSGGLVSLFLEHAMGERKGLRYNLLLNDAKYLFYSATKNLCV